MVRFSGEIVMKDKSSAQQNGIASRYDLVVKLYSKNNSFLQLARY